MPTTLGDFIIAYRMLKPRDVVLLNTPASPLAENLLARILLVNNISNIPVRKIPIGIAYKNKEEPDTLKKSEM
jgi:hypothetical protein